MKVRYDREDDALMMYVGEGSIDYAEEMGELIVHFTAEGRPVLIEVLDASEFLARLTRITATAPSGVERPL